MTKSDCDQLARRELRLNAWRYRVGGDALRFICETHQPLPMRPPPQRGTLVLFAHYDPHGLVDPYVVYYVQALKRLGATILFVSGSPRLEPESVEPLRSLCIGIYTRHTLSLDFGSWHLAWNILHERGWSLDDFDRLILANDSVYGPLFPLEEMWGSFEGADMYGSIESAEQVSHLQSFFLAWELNSRTRPFLNDFWGRFRYVVDKYKIVQKYEIGVTRSARMHGLQVKPFISIAAIKDAHQRSPTHQWAQKFSDSSLNNSLYFYDGLIEHLRFPFIKTVLPRTGSPEHDSLKDLSAFIAAHTEYPYALIQANLDRLGCNAIPARPSEKRSRHAPGGRGKETSRSRVRTPSNMAMSDARSGPAGSTS
jgi:lipopolysaccharide biosynthesis protein